MRRHHASAAPHCPTRMRTDVLLSQSWVCCCLSPGRSLTPIPGCHRHRTEYVCGCPLCSHQPTSTCSRSKQTMWSSSWMTWCAAARTDPMASGVSSASQRRTTSSSLAPGRQWSTQRGSRRRSRHLGDLSDIATYIRPSASRGSTGCSLGDPSERIVARYIRPCRSQTHRARDASAGASRSKSAQSATKSIVDMGCDSSRVPAPPRGREAARRKAGRSLHRRVVIPEFGLPPAGSGSSGQSVPRHPTAPTGPDRPPASRGSYARRGISIRPWRAAKGRR
jgi:hypothetical protein